MSKTTVSHLPIRTSIHDNINVAETPSPDLPDHRPTTSTQKPAESANSKRKFSSREEEVAAELPDLQTENFSPQSKKRTKRPSAVSLESSDNADDDDTIPTDFVFRAICTYRGPDTIDKAFDFKDLQCTIPELWERTDHVKEIWERRKGQGWQAVFIKKESRDRWTCVTQTCKGKRTYWGRGRSSGMFACTDCVKAGLPCFVPSFGEGKMEFLLLPLHDRERKLPVARDFELRYWINDGIELVLSEDDMDYSDS